MMDSHTLFILWLKSFAFTLVLEAPVFGLVGWKTAPVWRLLAAGAAGTCITHPALWFLWPRLFRDYTTYIVTGELLVSIIESFTFYALARPITLLKAVSASFLANATSYGCGVIMHKLGMLT